MTDREKIFDLRLEHLEKVLTFLSNYGVYFETECSDECSVSDVVVYMGNLCVDDLDPDEVFEQEMGFVRLPEDPVDCARCFYRQLTDRIQVGVRYVDTKAC